MKISFCLIGTVLIYLTVTNLHGAQRFRADSGDTADINIVNTNIDMEGFLKIANEAATWREKHRLTEEEFIRVSKMPDTVILDARSGQAYDLLHVKGAVNLSFPDITANSLAQTIPKKSTRILIYCNNNFDNSPRAFAAKAPPASLNLSTYISLYTYGYKNVYELGPFLKIHHTKIQFESNQGAAPGI
jgi:hypothetical protein